MSFEQCDPAANKDRIPLHCLRAAETGPPQLTTLLTGTPVYVMRTHADVRQMLTDPRIGRAPLYAPDAPPITPYPNLLDDPDSLLNLDGEEHQRLRRTVQRAFTPRAIARWRPWVASVVEELVSSLTDSAQPADLIGAFSRPLPVAVISRLMGLDGLDHERISYWSDHGLSTSAYPPEQIQAAFGDFFAFGNALVDKRRAEPGDDLVSSLVLAADQDGGLTQQQVVSLTIGLVVAGHETTMTALGNTLVYLLSEGREAWERLAESEERAAAVAEQLLRVIPLGEGVVLPGFIRRAREDVEIGGVLIPAGSVVAGDGFVANHDPQVYPADWRDRLFEPVGTPHLAFGAGPHHCIGTWLARMEMELALHRLARRLPGLRLAVPLDGIDWRGGQLTRSPQTLPVTW